MNDPTREALYAIAESAFDVSRCSGEPYPEGIVAAVNAVLDAVAERPVVPTAREDEGSAFGRALEAAGSFRPTRRTPMTTDTLRGPVLPERRIGWWFMRTFRPWEVARRTARNELLEAAWKVNTEAFVDDAQHRRLFAAVDALNAVDDRRSRFGRLQEDTDER